MGQQTWLSVKIGHFISTATKSPSAIAHMRRSVGRTEWAFSTEAAFGLAGMASEGKGCGLLQSQLQQINPFLACFRLQVAHLQAAVGLECEMWLGFCFFELSKPGNPLPLPWLQGKREAKIFVCCCNSLAFKAEMLFMQCQQRYCGQSGHEL